MSRRKAITDEQERFIFNNYKLYGLQELTQAFNDEFGTSKTSNAIKAYLAKFHLRRTVLTDEEKEFILNHLDEYTINEFADILFSEYGHKLSERFIRNQLIAMGTPKKFYYPSRTYHDVSSSYSIGSIRKKWHGGYYEYLIRMDDRVNEWGHKITTWMPYGRYLWEQAYGPLPDDVQVIHLNGDVNDFSLENLYPVNRQQHAFLTNNKWHGLGEITRTGLLINDLQQLVKEEM